MTYSSAYCCLAIALAICKHKFTVFWRLFIINREKNVSTLHERIILYDFSWCLKENQNRRFHCKKNNNDWDLFHPPHKKDIKLQNSWDTSRNHTVWLTDRPTDGQTRCTDRCTDKIKRQKDRLIERQTDGQTNGCTAGQADSERERKKIKVKKKTVDTHKHTQTN